MSLITISDLLRAQATSRPLEIYQYLVLQFLHLQKYTETNTREKSTDISNTAQLRSEFTMESIILLEEKKWQGNVSLVHTVVFLAWKCTNYRKLS